MTPKYATLACGLFLPQDNQGLTDSGRDIHLPLNHLEEFRRPVPGES